MVAYRHGLNCVIWRIADFGGTRRIHAWDWVWRDGGYRWLDIEPPENIDQLPLLDSEIVEDALGGDESQPRHYEESESAKQ